MGMTNKDSLGKNIIFDDKKTLEDMITLWKMNNDAWQHALDNPEESPILIEEEENEKSWPPCTI